MKLGVKIAIAFVLGLLIVGTVGIQSYLGIQRLTDTNRWVTHSHEVLEDLEHVASLLKDAETGQRGFILTGEERYLEPYNAATAEIPKDIDAVTALTKDSPQQQSSLQQLQKLSHDKLDELQETVKLRKAGGVEAALPVIRSDRGRRIMDDIRAIIDQMELRERGLLGVRNRAASEVTQRTMVSLGAGVLLALVVLGVAAVIVTRTMRLANGDASSQGAGRNWPRIAIRYAFAVAVVGLAMALRSWMERAFGPMPPFIIFYPAVLLVASIAGGGPGVLTTLLAVLAADYWYFPPYGQFNIGSSNEALALGIFGGSSLFLSVLAERVHRSRWAEAVSVTQEKELALMDMGNLMTLDLEHRIVHWSQGNHRLYGFDAQETRGQLTYELLQTHFDQPLEQIHGELLEKGHWEGDVTRRGKDGSPLSVSLLWALRRDEGGKPLDILEVSTDITRQKTAEEALRQQSEELAQQNEELTQQAEELSRQTEELTQQSEELSEQNEELQTQSEEIQTLNADLTHREKILQTLLDSARLPIGEREVMGKICQAALEIIGQPAIGVAVCERHGQELQILAHAGFGGAAVPGSWPVKGSFVEMVIQQGRTASLEDTSLRPDLNILSVPGHPRFPASLSSPLRVKGECIGAVSLYSDKPQHWTVEQFGLIEWLAAQCSNALEAMRAEEALTESRERLDLALHSARMATFDWDILANKRTWSEGVHRLLGTDPETFTGTADEFFKALHQDDRRSVQAALAKAVETTAPYETEYRVTWPDGSTHHIAARGMVHRDNAGRPIRMTGICWDITDRNRAEEELHRLNRTLKALGRSGQAMLRARDEEDYLNEACRIIVEDCGHAMVWIGYAENDAIQSVRPVASFGFDEGYIETLKVTWADTELGRGPTGTAIRTGKPAFCRNMLTDPLFGPWREQAVKRGYASSLVLPLISDGKAFGALTIYFREPDPFTPDEVSLLTELADDLAHGITAIRMRSARERAEEALQESERRYRSLFDNMLDGYAYCRMLYENQNPSDFVYLGVNDAFERLTGLKDVVGKKVSEVIPGIAQSSPELLQTYGRVAMTGQPERLETYLAALKTWFSIAVYSPAKDHFVAVFDNITERKRGEEALRESEDRLRTMADSIPQLAWVAKADGFIYWYNRRWYEYTGTTPEQMEGWGWQSVHDPNMLPAVMEQWQASIATGQPFDMEFPLRSADGKFRQFLTRGVPLKDAQGRVVQWCGTNTDISERAAAEAVLRQTAEELARSNKELEQFAYISSHDLQEPLRQVRAFVQLLRDRHADKLEGSAAEYLQFVYDGASRMSDLVQGLLAYSRVGARDARHESTPCQQALDAALSNLQLSIAESQACITHDELPTVMAERTQLTQLFQNLIGNAIKFRQDGVAPRIHVACRREGRQWLFGVKDNGIGIDPEHYGKVFLIFQRLHGRERYPGTGIGLAICKKIVEQHGGKIWIDSKVGEGSSFCFTLPEESV